MTGERKQARWQPFAISLLFFLPVISGVVNRLTEPSRWFRDYNAMACGAEKWLEGAPIYDRALSCAGIDAMPFVYHPWVAQAFAWPLSMLGQQGLVLAYAGAYFVAIAAIFWLIVGRSAPTPRARRAWFAGFMTGSTVVWGNVAILVHALVGVVAIQLRKRPSVLVLAIAVSAIIKPVFLTFAAIFLIAQLPLWRRLAYAAAAIALGAAPTAYFVATGGEMVEQWRELLAYWIYVGKPGDSYLGWLNMISIAGDSMPATLGYLAFAGVAVLCAIVLAEGLAMPDDERGALGVSVGILAIPRLMSHDMMLLGLGFAATLTAISAASDRAGKWFGRALLAICVLALVGNMADLADWTTRICTFLLSLYLIVAAIWVVTSRQFGASALLRAVWTGRTSAPA